MAIIVIVVAVAALLIVFRNKIFKGSPAKSNKSNYSLSSSNEAKIKDYISKAKAEGMSNKQIKQSMVKSGWKEQDINKYL